MFDDVVEICPRCRARYHRGLYSRDIHQETCELYIQIKKGKRADLDMQEIIQKEREDSQFNKAVESPMKSIDTRRDIWAPLGLNETLLVDIILELINDDTRIYSLIVGFMISVLETIGTIHGDSESIWRKYFAKVLGVPESELFSSLLSSFKACRILTDPDLRKVVRSEIDHDIPSLSFSNRIAPMGLMRIPMYIGYLISQKNSYLAPNDSMTSKQYQIRN